MQLNNTAKTILGMLRRQPRTGYEIKGRVDVSTRFFWATSYGQLYPELKRLEEQGLVEGVADPQGGRQRTVYSLTDDGREALLEWMRSDEEPLLELRDEGLLKFFFADALPPEEQIEIVRRRRRKHEQGLEQLLRIEPTVAKEGFPYKTLQYGIAHHEWVVEWCREMEAELGNRPAPRKVGKAGN